MSMTPKYPPAILSTDPSSHPAVREVVRWTDPEDVRLWIAALRSAAHDGLAAGEDAVRPKRERVLSRDEARRKLEAADKTVTSLLEAGERGLPRPPQTS